VTRFVFLTLLVLLNGCGAGWRRTPDLGLGPLPRRQQAQVWYAGRSERWHAVDVRVDSVRFGNPSAGFWKTFGLAVSPVVLLVVICTFPSQPCGTID
jgi:hypothetical protein